MLASSPDEVFEEVAKEVVKYALVKAITVVKTKHLVRKTEYHFNIAYCILIDFYHKPKYDDCLSKLGKIISHYITNNKSIGIKNLLIYNGIKYEYRLDVEQTDIQESELYELLLLEYADLDEEQCIAYSLLAKRARIFLAPINDKFTFEEFIDMLNNMYDLSKKLENDIRRLNDLEIKYVKRFLRLVDINNDSIIKCITAALPNNTNNIKNGNGLQILIEDSKDIEVIGNCLG